MNLVFDWAGTLANDQELTWRLTNETVRTFGHDPITFETYRNEFVLPADSFYRQYCPGSSWEEVETVFRDLSWRRYPSAVNLWPGVRDGLACLGCKHKLFLMSTLEQSMLEESLELLGIRTLFQRVYGSVEDKTQVLPLVLKDLGLSLDETVFIGDTPHDILAAKTASIQPLAVSYGYTSAIKLLNAEPDLIFDSFAELLRYLDKLAFAESRHFPVATVGGLIFDEDGKTLLVRTRKWSNLFGVPGGKIDYGETMHAAFIREAKEETGLDIREVVFVMNQDCVEHPEFYRPRHYILVNYTAQVSGKQPKVKLNHESDAFIWVEPREALGLALNEPTRVLIEKLLAGEGF
jgi:phosphoglycolate phosphatase